jgi:hypothetical protein
VSSLPVYISIHVCVCLIHRCRYLCASRTHTTPALDFELEMLFQELDCLVLIA